MSVNPSNRYGCRESEPANFVNGLVERVSKISDILAQDRILDDLQWRARHAKAEAEAELKEQELKKIKEGLVKDAGDKPKKKTPADRIGENAEARRDLLLEKEKLIK